MTRYKKNKLTHKIIQSLTVSNNNNRIKIKLKIKKL